MVNIKINGIKIKVKKNITVLQACNTLNIEIPKFCFQENLNIAGNCRMCLVEIKNLPKPVASCAMPVSNNMEIFTNTPLVQKARESVLEFILINHPLDCPICDQGGECDLQEQTMFFGGDRSRFFFFKKRGIEDKNVGPFIKTIMTRCIHCTRCVRFAEEICGIDNFGTTGRGNLTEINFYDKNIFYSEFSGNLIDLCPVGALTSKPYAFKARPWEIIKKEGIDILDGIGSNFVVDSLKNEIIRILPKTNVYINKEWINNKTRFFFDSLKYQRIEKPMIKNEEGFKEILWEDAFKLINKKILSYDSSQIQTIVGNLTDLESNFLLKKTLNLLGISNISYLYPNKKENFFNSDITSNYLFNTSFKSLEKTDLCLIINSDIRNEGSILNIHLINRLKKGNFDIFYIGEKKNYTYPTKHLGISIDTFITIIQGKHSFCKKFKKAKNPVIILGTNFFYQLNNSSIIIEKLKKLSFTSLNTFNILHSQSAYLNFLEIFNKKYNFQNQNNNFYYLYNTNFQKKIKKTKNDFVVYQGHHFTFDANLADIILPSLTFLEKKGIYLNTEGFIQKNNIIIERNTDQRSDFSIFKYLNIFIQKKNNNNFKNKKNIKFEGLLSYIKKKKLHVINFYVINKKKINQINKYSFYSLKKKLYIDNVLINYSKILLNSIKLLKNKSNFLKN